MFWATLRFKHGLTQSIPIVVPRGRTAYILLKMNEKSTDNRLGDRKLGDEWADWDGTTEPESSEAGSHLFLWLAGLAALLLIVAAAGFLWLIYPRLAGVGTVLTTIVTAAFFVFAGAMLVWTVLFAWSAAIQRPVSRLVILPTLINRLLTVVAWVGKRLGISTDRLTNSFLKTHNALLNSQRITVPAERLLLLAPRCLTREANKRLRQMRDDYGFVLHVVGGGTDARLKIRKVRPWLVLAIACERDLLSGFKEVNPHVPVIGIPNARPEGPCKNTCVDLDVIEGSIRRFLGQTRTASNSVDK